MSTPTTIRLLMVSDALDDAEYVASLMRQAGYTIKPVRAEDAEELDQALGSSEIDLAMYALGTEDVSLEGLVQAMDERGLAIPVLAFGEGSLTPGEALAAGAADRIQAGDDQHIRHALIRELDRVRSKRRVQRLEAAYHDTEERARALMASSRDAIAYIHDGMHVLANDAYLERFGYDAFEQIEGLPMIDLVAATDQKKLKEFLRNFSASEEAVGTLELALQPADAESFKAEVEFSRASIEGEACSQIIIRDRGDTAALEKQLYQLSRCDHVTGLYNRQHFMQLLQEALERAASSRAHSALFELALDDFESVKDRVGVLGADRVLASIASVLCETVGSEASLARLDGATFGMLADSADTESLDELARRVRGAVRDHICEIEHTSICMTATIGVALIDGSTTDANDILSRAQRAYREAAEAGADAHRIYKPKKGEVSQREIDQQWVAMIRETLKNDRLRLLYRPIVTLTEDSHPRYEVIPEVLDESGNPIDDPELAAAAERTGMSKGLDRWVVLHALKALVEQLKSDRGSTFFVRLSGHAFDDPGLYRWIDDRLKQIQLPEGALVLQVDARAAANRVKQAGAFATAVHELGCRLCLSGFGHGSDPFQVIRHVQADYIRVNEEFAKNLAQNAQNQEAIRQIASQASDQGIRTLCPGVADAASLSVLWGLGTNMVEGDFLQEASTARDYDFAAMAL